MKLKRAIDIINGHMIEVGWKFQDDLTDKAIASLSPKQIIENDACIHKDLSPYLSAYHVSWLFEVCWADVSSPEHQLEGGPPEGHDPTIPLGQGRRWHPADR